MSMAMADKQAAQRNFATARASCWNPRFRVQGLSVSGLSCASVLRITEKLTWVPLPVDITNSSENLQKELSQCCPLVEATSEAATTADGLAAVRGY